MKYPIGIQSFDQIIGDGYVYVDKTGLIYRLVNEGKIYFLSRPRRFGKSLLVSTLKCYFQGRKELFKGLAIDKLETDWAEYPVFHIDFSQTDFLNPNLLEEKLEENISAWEQIYGKGEFAFSLGSRFAYVLKQAHKQSGRRCVVLIDEYDKPVVDALGTGLKIKKDINELLLETYYKQLLGSFYSTLKASDEDLHFILITGMTRFTQATPFSGFNNFSDISTDRRYETLCGITQEELEHYFAEPIKALAVKYKVTEEGMLDMLKHRYDGYHFSGNLTDVYNPFSLLNAFAKKALRDYWFSSGTPSYLVRLLNHTQENLNELTGRYYRPEEFVDYKADVEKPLPMIYQSGYLTIKGYERTYNRFLLDFPNNEVKNGFVSLIAADYLKPQENMKNWVIDVVESLKHGDVEQLRKLFTSFLAGIPYSMRAKKDEAEKERFFHYTLYLIFRLISVYTVYTEKEQSQGRADCIVETDDYIYIFEFKRDGTADEALVQIEAKGYARPYAADPRTLYKIGVNFSSETGTVEDWKTV